MGNDASRRGFCSTQVLTPYYVNNISPLKFHSVHGENIHLSKNDTVATREGGFCRAIAFSHRPVAVNEYIYIKFLDVQRCWSGALRIGFTTHDPVQFRNKLPKYSCPCMTETPGNWARALTERFAVTNSVLFYYVDTKGDVHYGVNNEERGIFFSGVSTTSKLWALMDVYGNSVKIELLDPRQMHNMRLERLSGPFDAEATGSNASVEPCSSIVPNLFPFSFHPSRGRDACVIKNRAFATHISTPNQCGYVFSEKSIGVNECVVLRVHQCNEFKEDSMIIGVTSCPPSSLRMEELPDDPNDLYDRPEYWVFQKCEPMLQPKDVLVFVIESDGALRFSRNGGDLSLVFYVDITANLWFFVNLCGSVIEIRSEGIYRKSEDENVVALLRYIQGMSSGVIQLHGQSVSDHPQHTANSECVICCEKSPNCALYRCGHVCMCYHCALVVKDRDPQCPLCREAIVDVIQIFT